MNRNPQPGRSWSTFGFAIGIGASIAANVAHSYVRPAHAPAGWAPQPGAIVAAAFWPIALVISIEVISRVQWPHRWYWALIRYVGLSAVALIAAVISYGHLSALMRFYGEDSLSSTIGPLAVDGLMVVCSGALLAIGENIRRAAESPRELPGTQSLPETTSVEQVEPGIPVDSGNSTPRPPRKRPPSTTAAAKVASAARRLPDGSVAAIAARAGVSETTARRHLATLQAASPTAPVPAETNGHSFAEVSA